MARDSSVRFDAPRAVRQYSTMFKRPSETLIYSATMTRQFKSVSELALFAYAGHFILIHEAVVEEMP
jgi:hypothetical protein